MTEILPLEGSCVFVMRCNIVVHVLGVVGDKGVCVPGGALMPGETPAAAAARELFEETGLQLTPGGVLRPLGARTTDNGVLCHGFWVPVEETEGALHDSVEGDTQWLLPSDLILHRRARFPDYCEQIVPRILTAYQAERGVTTVGQPPGRKDTEGKDPWDLLPWEPIQQIVKVLGFGLRKYSRGNWKFVPEPRDKYFSALMRHLVSWRDGEQINPESGLPHLAHAGCCLVFLLWFDLQQEKHAPSLTDKQEAVNGKSTSNGDTRISV